MHSSLQTLSDSRADYPGDASVQWVTFSVCCILFLSAKAHAIIRDNPKFIMCEKQVIQTLFIVSGRYIKLILWTKRMKTPLLLECLGLSLAVLPNSTSWLRSNKLCLKFWGPWHPCEPWIESGSFPDPTVASIWEMNQHMEAHSLSALQVNRENFKNKSKKYKNKKPFSF